MAGLLAAGFAFAIRAAPCAVSSGTRTAALVELYTAQACPRCAAAERWLEGVVASIHDVVPLVLYVDPREPARRERRLTPRQRMALVFNPAVKLQGRDYGAWESPSFDDALSRINARPPRARLRLEIRAVREAGFLLEVRAEVLDPALVQDAVLYIASYERRRLNTVREWQGPAALGPRELALEREVALVPGAHAADSGVAGFVQNRRNLEVLQTLALPSCP